MTACGRPTRRPHVRHGRMRAIPARRLCHRDKETEKLRMTSRSARGAARAVLLGVGCLGSPCAALANARSPKLNRPGRNSRRGSAALGPMAANGGERRRIEHAALDRARPTIWRGAAAVAREGPVGIRRSRRRANHGARATTPPTPPRRRC